MARRSKFPFSTWRILPCEDPHDKEEVEAKISAHVLYLHDVCGLVGHFISSEISDGTRWARFQIEGRA